MSTRVRNPNITLPTLLINQCPATATIRNGIIILSSLLLPAPIAASYAFRDFLVGELFSPQGYAVSSFRTDWKLVDAEFVECHSSSFDNIPLQAFTINIYYLSLTFHLNKLLMLSNNWSKRIVVILIACMLIPCFRSSAQRPSDNDLYRQTSEMADIMIQYDADKASIRRFYSTAGTQQQAFGQQQQGLF